MAPLPLLLYLLISTINLINTQTIECKGDCQCPPAPAGTTCTLNCLRKDSCKSKTLTCRPNDPCTINCIAKAVCASSTTILAGTSTHVDIVCSGEDACKDNIDITCGTGPCSLTCTGALTVCENFGNINVDNAKSFDCTGAECPGNIPAPFTALPTLSPTIPTLTPTNNPTIPPTNNPTVSPTSPTNNPTLAPTFNPTKTTNNPTQSPTPSPTKNPTPAPTFDPTPAPTNNPTPAPTTNPTISTQNPTPAPTKNPTPAPTFDPTPSPTNNPTPAPTLNPTPAPTNNPIPAPTHNPSSLPTYIPSVTPTNNPSRMPTVSPTHVPTYNPSLNPTRTPTYNPTVAPTVVTSVSPTQIPSTAPLGGPTRSPEGQLVIPNPTVTMIYTSMSIPLISTDNDGGLRVGDAGDVNLTMIVVIICAVVAGISCMVGGGVFLWSFQQKRKRCSDGVESDSGIDYKMPQNMKVNSISNVETGMHTNDHEMEMANMEGSGLIDDTVFIDGNDTRDVNYVIHKVTVEKTELELRKEEDEKAEEIFINSNYETPRPPPRRQRPESVYNENADEKAEELSDSDEDVLFTGIKTPQ